MIAIEKQAALATANQTTVSSPEFKPRFIKIGTASAYSGIGRSTLYEMLNAGKIKSHKVGGARLIDRESLDAYISAQPA